jgi:hypothetical protein
MTRTAAALDSPQASERQAWWFLDTLVVEHQTASGTGPVVLEMTLPAGAAPPLHLHHDLDDSSFLLDDRTGRPGDAPRRPWIARPRRRERPSVQVSLKSSWVPLGKHDMPRKSRLGEPGFPPR